MTRTPFFWFLLYVHTAFGVAALVTSLWALRTPRGSVPHRRAGWWYAQSLAGLFVTTALMASIRYTLFLFVIGYAAWYTSHQAWLTVARRDEQPYLAGPLVGHVRHDLAMVLGVVQVAAALAMLFQRAYPITPWGLGLGVAFVWGSVLATLGWVERSGRAARLTRRQRHVLHIGVSVIATWSEFFADVTVHLMSATLVWIVAWILPALAGTWLIHRVIDLRTCFVRVAGPDATPAAPAGQAAEQQHT